MIFLTTGKSTRSIILGFAGFCGAFFSVSVNFPPLSVTILWSYFLPLLAGMAYGTKYALIAGILGLGAFFPFVLWPTNGWANGVTSILYFFSICLVWLFCIDKRAPSGSLEPSIGYRGAICPVLLCHNGFIVSVGIVFQSALLGTCCNNFLAYSRINLDRDQRRIIDGFDYCL